MHRRDQQGIEKANGSCAYGVNAQLASQDSAVFAVQENRFQTQPTRQDGIPGAADEAALVNLARLGDQDAFASLINGHVKTLYRRTLRITKNHEDAEDAVQDAILKAHVNLSKFQGRARFSTWMTRIAINEALMKLRKNRRIKQVPLEVPAPTEELIVRFPQLELRGEDPEALYARTEVRETMMQAARSLLPMYQEVFFLARVKGCTNQETADELEVSVSTVKARLHRACKQLREKLHPVVGDLPC